MLKKGGGGKKNQMPKALNIPRRTGIVDFAEVRLWQQPW